MSMTLKQLRDWHAKRTGLRVVCEGMIEEGWIDAKGNEVQHPFPPTLDGADASMPPNWVWRRYGGEGWRAFTVSGDMLQARTDDTGDKPRDLYELSKLAWEQEAAR